MRILSLDSDSVQKALYVASSESKLKSLERVGGFGRVWSDSEGFGRVWMGRFWKVSDGFGRFWTALLIKKINFSRDSSRDSSGDSWGVQEVDRSGGLEVPSLTGEKVSEGFGQFWEGFGRFRKVLDSFGKVLEGFGRFRKVLDNPVD